MTKWWENQGMKDIYNCITFPSIEEQEIVLSGEESAVVFQCGGNAWNIRFDRTVDPDAGWSSTASRVYKFFKSTSEPPEVKALGIR
jgi:hypothetical protein